MKESFLDMATAKSRLLSRILSDRIKRVFTISPLSNALCPVASVFAAGLLHGRNDALYIAAFTVMLVVWAQASALCGFRRKWFFVCFGTAFWVLPRLFIAASVSETQNVALDGFNKLLTEISKLVSHEALSLVNRFTDLSDLIFAATLILLYYIGTRARISAQKSDFYCRTRLEQLE